MKTLCFALILSSIILTGCSTINEEQVIGTWEYEISIPNEDLKGLDDYKELQEMGFEADLMLDGEVEYKEDGSFKIEGILEMLMVGMGQEILMEFEMVDIGTWELDGDYIVTISEEMTVVPANELTEQIAAEDPTMMDGFKAQEGEEGRDLITSISDTEMIIESTFESLEIVATYKKK